MVIKVKKIENIEYNMTLILLGFVIDFRYFRKETNSAIIHRFE